MGKRGRKKGKPLTEEQLAERRDRYNANRRVRRRAMTLKRQEERRVGQEIGRIVSKMNQEAGLSQEAIWELLAGLASRAKIRKWCEMGKQRGKMENR